MTGRGDTVLGTWTRQLISIIFQDEREDPFYETYTSHSGPGGMEALGNILQRSLRSWRE